GELFFYAALIPAWVLLGSLRVRRSYRLLFLSLLLVSPQYVYWSRSFMIESTALFLSLAYLAAAVRGLDRPAYLVAAALAGALATMVKATPFVPFLLATIAFVAWRWWPLGTARFAWPTLLRFARWKLAAVFVPLACGVGWTLFTDSLKDANPL